MAPSKLSDTEKQKITYLYCQPGETTSTLANQFGVSSSTVSRVLKQQLSEADYAQLMQWKRGGERGELELARRLHTDSAPAAPEEEPKQSAPSATASATEPSPVESEAPPTTVADASPVEIVEPPSTGEPESSEAAEEGENPAQRPVQKLTRRSRRRSRTQNEKDTEAPDSSDQLPLQFDDSDSEAVASLASHADPAASTDLSAAAADDEADAPPENSAVDWDEDDLSDADDYGDDDDDYDDDEELDDEDESEDAIDDDEEPSHWKVPTKAGPITASSRREQLEILPFEALTLQKPCYLVVDRLSELITCPLKDFSDLGTIPEAEEQARTLPIFDNHRVARRFSRRNQRIVKIPDGMMLSKTQPYLSAKGITRLLFDGHVYAL